MLCGGTLFTCRGSVISNCDLLTDLKICLNTIVFWKSTCDETLTLLSSWVFITTISFRLLGLFISGDHSRLGGIFLKVESLGLLVQDYFTGQMPLLSLSQHY